MKRLFKNRFKTKVHSKNNGYVIKYSNIFGIIWITLDKCFVDKDGLPYMDEWVFEKEVDAVKELIHFKTMGDVGRHWNREISFFAEQEKKLE